MLPWVLGRASPGVCQEAALPAHNTRPGVLAGLPHQAPEECVLTGSTKQDRGTAPRHHDTAVVCQKVVQGHRTSVRVPGVMRGGGLGNCAWARTTRRAWPAGRRRSPGRGQMEGRQASRPPTRHTLGLHHAAQVQVQPSCQDGAVTSYDWDSTYADALRTLVLVTPLRLGPLFN